LAIHLLTYNRKSRTRFTSGNEKHNAYNDRISTKTGDTTRSTTDRQTKSKKSDKKP
jgi:hypothetical protein